MDHLIVDQRLAEGAALLRVGDGVAHGLLHARIRGDRADQPLALELLHLEDEAHALRADGVRLGHAHVVEDQLRRVARPVAELLQRATDAESRRLVGTMISDMPRKPASSLVRASRQTQSACAPLVM